MAGGDYGRIRHTFWSDPEIKRTLSAEQKALLLYYFANPHCNLIGLYYCPLEYAALEVGLPLEQVEAWIDGPLARFLTYDHATEEVLVHRLARHQIDRQLKEADKRVGRVKRELAEAHSQMLVQRFAELYPDWPHGIEPTPPPADDGDGEPKGHPAPPTVENPAPEAPSKPLPSPTEAKAGQGMATTTGAKAPGADALRGTSGDEDASAEDDGGVTVVLHDDAEWLGDVPDAPPGVIQLRRPKPVEDAVLALVPVVGPRINGAQVLRAWLSMQARMPTEREKDRQGAVAKRIARNYPPIDIARAFIGMGTLAPHKPGMNEPWDLVQLEQKFTRAAEAARNHPAVKQQQADDEFDSILDQQQRGAS